MADFSQEIHDFSRYGTYTYEFDSVGNSVFNTSSTDFSQVFIAFPLTNFNYNDVKLESFYTSAFQEFIPNPPLEITTSVDTLTQQLAVIQTENDTLKTQLNSIIEESNTNTTESMNDAFRQVIIELRIALGQGRVAANFPSNFPFSPLVEPPSTS